jgi:hypothetical protein
MVVEGARTRALRARRQRRRQRTALAAGLLAAAGLVAVAGLIHLGRTAGPPVADASAADVPSASEPTPGPAPAGPPPSFPVTGPDTFTYAAGSDEVLGGGTAAVKTFRVAVENGSGQDVGAFTRTVRRVLADPRGWTAGGDVRFQRVGKDAPGAQFTIMLATQVTADKLCAVGGVHTGQLTSCRLPGQLVVNLTRWLTAVPGYGAPLDEYQAYEINYAVGRELGHANEGCPNPGRPAPVMQKQVLGLKGCTANGWPYRDGARYTGPPVP